MQEQNLEEWKEKIDRSAEQITVPDTLTPGAVQQMLEERKNRTSAGRKEHRHYRRFAGIAAAVAVLVIAVGTYGWNKYGTDDAQPKKAALSVTETVDSTQDTASYKLSHTIRQTLRYPRALPFLLINVHPWKALLSIQCIGGVFLLQENKKSPPVK
jgi:hypothetical protein